MIVATGLAFIAVTAFFNNNVSLDAYYWITVPTIVLVLIFSGISSKTVSEDSKSVRFRPVDLITLASFFLGLILLEFSDVIHHDGNRIATIGTAILFILFLCSLTYGLILGLVETIELAAQRDTTRSITIFLISVVVPGVFLFICLISWIALRYWT